MPIPAGVSRITFTGRLPGGEIFSTGFWLSGTGVSDQGAANALAQLMWGEAFSSDASGAMRIAADYMWGPTTYCDRVMTYTYAGGSSQAEFIGEYAPTSPINGAASQASPNQIALVLTLRSGLPGRRYRGRMYLPASGVAFAGDGQASSSITDAVSTAFGIMFTDINQSDTGKVVIVSATGSVATPVTGVTMDTRADVQRRRANSQSIDHVSSHAVAA